MNVHKQMSGVTADTLLEALDLSVRGENCMRELMAETGVQKLRDLNRFTRAELLKRKNWGKIQLREVEEYMARAGLHLALEGPLLVDGTEPLAEVERLKKLLNLDQTGLAEALNSVRKLIRGWEWVGVGEWACYSYEEHTVETLRGEWQNFEGQALEVIGMALRKSGQRADSAFHLTPPPVEERKDAAAELARVQALLVEALEELATIADVIPEDELAAVEGTTSRAVARVMTERDALRETVSRLNRRCQTLESGIAEKVRECGPSFGRALANAAATKYRHDAERLLEGLRVLWRGYVERPEECADAELESMRSTPQARAYALKLLDEFKEA